MPPKKRTPPFFWYILFGCSKRFFFARDSFFSRIPGQWVRLGNWHAFRRCGLEALPEWNPPSQESMNFAGSMRFGNSGFEAPSWHVKHLCIYFFVVARGFHTSQASASSTRLHRFFGAVEWRSWISMWPLGFATRLWIMSLLYQCYQPQDTQQKKEQAFPRLKERSLQLHGSGRVRQPTTYYIYRLCMIDTI